MLSRPGTPRIERITCIENHICIAISGSSHSPFHGDSIEALISEDLDLHFINAQNFCFNYSSSLSRSIFHS